MRAHLAALLQQGGLQQVHQVGLPADPGWQFDAYQSRFPEAPDIEIEKVQRHLALQTLLEFLGGGGLDGKVGGPLPGIQAIAEQIDVAQSAEWTILARFWQRFIRVKRQFKQSHHQIRTRFIHITGCNRVHRGQVFHDVQVFFEQPVETRITFRFAEQLQRPVGQGQDCTRLGSRQTGQFLAFFEVAHQCDQFLGQRTGSVLWQWV